MVNTKTYNTWRAMKERCLSKNNKEYKRYGGRGITICEEWLTFINFYKDMGERPEGKTLDRINNNGNYCKENCRWATIEEQCNNRRSSRFIFYQGKRQTLTQWERELKLNSNIISRRLNRGWSIEAALK